MRMVGIILLFLISFLATIGCQEYAPLDAGRCKINGITYWDLDCYDPYCSEEGIVSYYKRKWSSDSIAAYISQKRCESENADYRFTFNTLTGFFELTLYGQKEQLGAYCDIQRGTQWEYDSAGHLFNTSRDFYSDSTVVFFQNYVDTNKFFCKNLTEEPIDLLVQDSSCDKVFLEKMDEFFRHPCADGQ